MINKDSSWICECLVIALGGLSSKLEVYPEEVKTVLIEILSSEKDDEAVRSAAAIGLGFVEASIVVDPLIDALEYAIKHNKFGLAYSAITALGRIRDPKSITILTRALTIQAIGIPNTAAEALENFGAEAKESVSVLKKIASEGNEIERKSAQHAIEVIEGSE